MKFIAVITTAVSLVSVASAWHLQLYRDELYQNIIEDRSGTLPQPCKNLGWPNLASSMHWYASTFAGTIVLYDGADCSGEVLGQSPGSWNLPSFSSHANDKVSSYKINA